MGRSLAWLGIVLFAVAWFLPVHEDLKGVDRSVKALESALENVFQGEEGRPRADTTYSGPPGWKAFRFAWDLLTKPDEMPPLKNKTLLGLTSLTNFAMVVAILALLLGGRSLRGLGIALLGCAFLNLGWQLWSDGAEKGLQIGYWLWVASFAVVGLSFVTRDSAAAPA